MAKAASTHIQTPPRAQGSPRRVHSVVARRCKHTRRPPSLALLRGCRVVVSARLSLALEVKARRLAKKTSRSRHSLPAAAATPAAATTRALLPPNCARGLVCCPACTPRLDTPSRRCSLGGPAAPDVLGVHQRWPGRSTPPRSNARPTPWRTARVAKRWHWRWARRRPSSRFTSSTKAQAKPWPWLALRTARARRPWSKRPSEARRQSGAC